jgi:sec-independent protein translocase protein TatB
MNPGIGMPEMMVVLILALVVVGPQQLPVMMRKVGRMVGQARMMARDFQNSFDEIGRDTELGELRKEIEALKRANPIEEIGGELGKAAQEAQGEKIRQLKISRENDFLPRSKPKPSNPTPSNPRPSNPRDDD